MEVNIIWIIAIYFKDFLFYGLKCKFCLRGLKLGIQKYLMSYSNWVCADLTVTMERNGKSKRTSGYKRWQELVTDEKLEKT